MVRLSMNLRFKIGAYFSIFIVILLGFLSVYHLHSLNENVQELLTADLKLIKFYDEVLGKIERLPLRINISLRNASPSQFLELLNDIGKIQSHLNQDIGLLPHQKASASIIIDDLEEYRKSLIALASDGFNELSPAYSNLCFVYSGIIDKLNVFENANLEVLSAHQLGISTISKSFQTRMGIVAFLTVSIAVALSLFFSQQITLPVRRIRDLINSMRDGHFETSTRINSEDEIGQIFNSLAHMADHLSIRDKLKIEKIDLEKRRFSTLANFLAVPMILINSENKVAFASNAFLELFKLSLNDIYELELGLTPLPPELKEKIHKQIVKKEWPQEEAFDIIGDSYAYELHLTFLPVKIGNNQISSVICMLGNVNRRENNNRRS